LKKGGKLNKWALLIPDEYEAELFDTSLSNFIEKMRCFKGSVYVNIFCCGHVFRLRIKGFD